MSTLLLSTYHGIEILQFDTGSSFLLKIHVIFHCQYSQYSNAAYEKFHLGLLQCFFKIKPKTNSQLFKKKCV